MVEVGVGAGLGSIDDFVLGVACCDFVPASVAMRRKHGIIGTPSFGKNSIENIENAGSKRERGKEKGTKEEIERCVTTAQQGKTNEWGKGKGQLFLAKGN